MLPKKGFINPSNGKLTFDETINEIASFIQAVPEDHYHLVIGTDSQNKNLDGKKFFDFVTAIVVHRDSKGGRYFWQKTKKEKIFSLRDKIYAETLLSIDTAKIVVPQLKTSLNGNGKYDLEIHVDVGEAGPTREMIKEIVGIVRGNGFTPKTKPESYGASSVADKHT